MKTYTSISKRWIAGLSALFTLSLFSSCLKTTNDYYAPPVAYVSVIQASPNEPPLDFYMNSNKVNLNPIMYGTEIDYFRAYTGTRIANFYYQGTTTKVFSDTIHLNTDVAYSLFLANTATHPEIVLLTDSLSKPPAGAATVRFVNVSPDAPAVDLAVQGSAALISNKAYKGSSPFVPLAANNNYTFQVLQHGTNTVLATLSNVPISSGLVYTIWFHGLVASTTATDKLSADIFTNAYYY